MVRDPRREGPFVELFVDARFPVCDARDTTGPCARHPGAIS